MDTTIWILSILGVDSQIDAPKLSIEGLFSFGEPWLPKQTATCYRQTSQFPDAPDGIPRS